MKYISLFSGIEAASVAWSNLGWEPLAFSEIEEFPCAVLKKRFPEVPNLGDVTKIDWKEWKNAVCDIIVGGSPCQSFSLAGKREGLNGASGLMWEYVRAVRAIRPQWFVWENVPGALSSSHGEDFRCLLESMDDLGYGLAWRVLDAQFFGVSQRRRRVFLVGHLGDRRAAEVLFESEGMSWDSASSREKRKALTQGTQNSARTAGGDCLTPWDGQLRRVYRSGGVYPTLNARDGKAGADGRGVLTNGFNYNDGAGARTLTATDRHAVYTSRGEDVFPALCATDGDKQFIDNQSVHGGRLLIDATEVKPTYSGTVRRLTPMECERLQGFADGYTNIPYRGKPHAPDSARYKALGNSMCVPVMAWIAKGIQEVEEGFSDERD